MKSDIAEIKNTLDGINSRLEEAEDWISEWEDRIEKNAHLEQQLEEKLRNRRRVEGSFGTTKNVTTSTS